MSIWLTPYHLGVDLQLTATTIPKCRASSVMPEFRQAACLVLAFVSCHMGMCCCTPASDDVLRACAGLLVQSFTQDGRFPTYCPGGTQPDPEYGFTVDKYSTVNVEEITINQDLSWFCAGNVRVPRALSYACQW